MSSKLRTIAVIDVGHCREAHAKQIAGRYASRRLGGQTLAHRIARRVSEATGINKVVITGAHLPTSLLTSGFSGADVLDLPHGHVCERLAAAADSYDADWIVYVPGNHPFIDPVLIDCLLNRAYQSAQDVDYVGYCGNNGCWERIRKLGVAGEVCHADALRRLRRNIDRLAGGNQDLSLAGWLKLAPGNFQMQFVGIPDALDHHDLRFSIEDERDWEFAELFSDHVRDDRTEWQHLAELVRDNLALRGDMALRNNVGV